MGLLWLQELISLVMGLQVLLIISYTLSWILKTTARFSILSWFQASSLLNHSVRREKKKTVASSRYLAVSRNTFHCAILCRDPSAWTADESWCIVGDLCPLLQAQPSHHQQPNGLREKSLKAGWPWREKQLMTALDVAAAGGSSPSATVMVSGNIYNHWKEENLTSSNWPCWESQTMEAVWGLGAPHSILASELRCHFH